MIKGLDSLSSEQQELLFRVNEFHTKCVGSDYKDGMEIIETWVNENNTVCARLKNGNWYHYTQDNTWF